MSPRSLACLSTLTLSLIACTFGGLLPSATSEAAPAPPAAPSQPSHPDWPTYHDAIGGFTLQHPEALQPLDSDGPVIFARLVDDGTTLGEEQLRIYVLPGATECGGSMAFRQDEPQDVVINGIHFVRERGADAGAGNLYETTSYTTVKDRVCICVSFTLHSTNPANYATPPPDFDREAEEALFEEIMRTFRFDP